MSKRRPRSLSEDDLEVWRRVARSTKPLGSQVRDRRPSPVKSGAEPPPAPATPAPTHANGRAAFGIGAARRPTDPGHDLAPTIERSLSSMPLRMDKKAFGKLKRGKLHPERKLDLHGMTLAESQPELIRFIRSAHADGCRLVIVVTGKGRSGRDEGGPIPSPRGVLRHHVPGWLHAAPLRPYVLQVTDAHVRHGGSGAYYVYLARG